jgi:hypothetical protein
MRHVLKSDGVQMKLCRSLIPAVLLLTFVTSSCAQTKQEREPVFATLPQLIWQYDTGG